MTPGLAAGRVEFNRDIRPVLSDACFACHGPDARTVKGGLRLDLRDQAVRPAKSGKTAIVPGRPDESELVKRLTTGDPDDLMPPAESHKTLSESQKDLFRRWIAEGAEYQGHWAYQPLVRPEVPEGAAAIDYLVQRRLGEVGLTHSQEADRRTLIRRLHADLVGIPPTPAEVESFEKDQSPGAYERLVDRLLASPQFGERMAIGWLDVVRFADTIGYHSDNPRNIWPYRDYVIRAFNSNKPFDQFTREQIAGDLLPNPTLEQRVASAFNRLLLTTEEGGAQEKDYEARYLTDRVRAVGTVWLGQTLGCAQCHDHKFDPVTSRDFYAMGAFFADIKEPIIGRREDGAFVPDERQAPELERHAREVTTLQAQYEGAHPELDGAYATWEKKLQASINEDQAWNALAPEAVTSSGGTKLSIRPNRSVLASGPNPERESYTLRFTNELSGVRGLRLEVIPDDSLPSKGPGRAGNGNFVLTEVVARVERPGKDPSPLAFRSAKASIEQTVAADKNPYGVWSAASVIDGNARGDSAGWAVLPGVGRIQRLHLDLEESISIGAGEVLVLELQQHHGNGGHNLGCFRVAATTQSDVAREAPTTPPARELAEVLQVEAGQRTDAQKSTLRKAFREQAPELAPLRERLEASKKARADFEATVPRCLVTEVSEKPRTVRILPRGNWLIETGDIMSPAFPAFLKETVPAPADRSLNRLDLANWLVSPKNPLTPRVVMNRWWRQFFGAGLSKVLDDFGAQGEPPRNPALLDWLACEFRDSGWNMKHMVRLIVLSRTYRQTSWASRELLARDPDNRELARQGRWRMDAELVRDGALSVAGLLVPRVGGPSAKPYQPDGYWENLNFPQRTYEASAGSDQYRRGLYTWWQRSFVHPSMLAFDAATREECAAERGRSNIPQQALVLLNDPTYVEAARALAGRVLAEGSGDDAARLTWAWRQALCRLPDASELSTLRSLLERQRASYRQDPEAASRFVKVGLLPVPAGMDPAELAAWTDVARAILNLHETITRS